MTMALRSRTPGLMFPLLLAIVAAALPPATAFAQGPESVYITVAEGPTSPVAVNADSVADLWVGIPDGGMEVPPPEGSTILWEVLTYENDVTLDPTDEYETTMTANFATAATYEVEIRCTVTNEIWGEDQPEPHTVTLTIVVEEPPPDPDPPVLSLTIVSMNFTSDHGVLTDKADNFEDGGTAYSKPDWTSDESKKNPVSHTWNSSVAVQLVIRGEPENAESQECDLAGSGPCGTFVLSGVVLGAGNNTVTVTSTETLPKAIDTLTLISWDISQDDTTLLSQSTGGSEPFFVTAGAPSGTQATRKRVAWAVTLADGKDDGPSIAGVVGPNATAHSRFDSSKSIWGAPPQYSTAWQIMDGNKGDCATLSTLMKYELEILGVTGATVKYVYARHDSWAGLVSSDPTYASMEHRVPETTILS